MSVVRFNATLLRRVRRILFKSLCRRAYRAGVLIHADFRTGKVALRTGRMIEVYSVHYGTFSRHPAAWSCIPRLPENALRSFVSAKQAAAFAVAA